MIFFWKKFARFKYLSYLCDVKRKTTQPYGTTVKPGNMKKEARKEFASDEKRFLDLYTAANKEAGVSLIKSGDMEYLRIKKGVSIDFVTPDAFKNTGLYKEYRNYRKEVKMTDVMRDTLENIAYSDYESQIAVLKAILATVSTGAYLKYDTDFIDTCNYSIECLEEGACC